MAGLHKSDIANPVLNWIDQRLPLITLMQKEYGSFPTPKNFNYFWNFGALAMINLAIMIATGVFLAMNYTAHTSLAFDSVERIMRDVNFGWLLRYVHANGATMFFVVVYVHIFRALYYGSYKAPREILFMLGVVILLLMMATAFMGYVLPWGQMSYWGATVITNLFSAIPIVGDSIVTWLWGGFSVDNPTLNRFFALHYLMPFMITGVVFLHIVALHITGSNNPLGIDVKSPQDTIPFHPYYTIKDSVGMCVYLLVFAVFVFFAPNYWGHSDNYIPANPLVTPAEIVPEWYFLPFYAILRSVPSKLGGVLLMFGSIAVLFILPWLDTSPVRSARFRPIYRQLIFVLVVSLFVLGFVGAHRPEGSGSCSAAWRPPTTSSTSWCCCRCWASWKRPCRSPRASAAPCCQAARRAARVAVVRCRRVRRPSRWRSRDAPSSCRPRLVAVLALPGLARAVETEPAPLPTVNWSFSGPFGTYDRASEQRGLQVWQGVCANCHSMKEAYYRNLEGIGLTPEQVKAFAAGITVSGGTDDAGQPIERPALPADHFRSPFANDKAARAANNGALPPDHSLIEKAREGGATYLYALLNGYRDPPSDMKMSDGMNYNIYFPGRQIAMAQPLHDGAVEYTDGTPATVEQMSKDVTTFLTYMAEPEMEQRKRMGLKIVLFLAGMTVVTYAVKRKIWADLH